MIQRKLVLAEPQGPFDKLSTNGSRSVLLDAARATATAAYPAAAPHRAHRYRNGGVQRVRSIQSSATLTIAGFIVDWKPLRSSLSSVTAM